MRATLLAALGLVATAFSPAADVLIKAATPFSPAADVLMMSQARAGPVCMSAIADEVERRRNLAIISHPDAGKTTLTEKLLLYGGAINQAGAVKAKGEQRRATSDFMALEQERGISISSTVLTYEYGGKRVNVLDTPGHQDFSEDTYRTLAAADNAVMLVDGAKGLEPQTRKLFEVARLRRLPLFTFVNKLDRPAMSPFEIIDQIEAEFGVTCVPVLWPIGCGDRFKGVLDRSVGRVALFARGERGKVATETAELALDDPALEEALGDAELYAQLLEDVEVLDGLARSRRLELRPHGARAAAAWTRPVVATFALEAAPKFLLRPLDAALRARRDGPLDLPDPPPSSPRLR